MNTRVWAVFLALILVAAQTFGAQSKEHQHTPGPAGVSHHACLDQERAALERGEGFGMALVADRNGYPGPRHLLDLKTELQLAPGQQAAVEELFARMQQQALARGKEVLVAEAQLDEMFARGRPEAELREQSFRVASLRAELRWAHLSAHLAARKLLTPEQLAAYQRLRHGEH
jgi:Spy/CpxP family protein refolding chaperone